MIYYYYPLPPQVIVEWPVITVEFSGFWAVCQAIGLSHIPMFSNTALT